MKKENWLDTEDTSYLICPHCGHEHDCDDVLDNTDYHLADNGDYECGGCDKVFKYSSHAYTDYTFSSRKFTPKEAKAYTKLNGFSPDDCDDDPDLHSDSVDS